MNLDEVLDKFGIFGRYHLQFMVISMFAYASNCMISATYIFAIEDTKYRCIDKAFNNNTCGTVNGVRCAEWVYDNPDSFVAELACQDWKRTLVGTVQSFGFMIGLFIVGPISDRLGRRKAILMTGIMCAALGLVQSFSPSYWFYVMLEFLITAVGDNYSPLFILNLEIISAKKRVIFQLLCGLGYVLGGILVPVIAWGIPYWRNYLRALYIPFFSIVTFYLIDESPRWLLAKGEKEKAINVLKKIANTNKIKLDQGDLNTLFVKDENKGITVIQSLKLTFHSRTLIKRCFVCIVWWTTSTFVAYGTIINCVSLQGSKYVNYALLQFVELPGNFIIMYILEKFKRKNPLTYTFFAAAVLFFVHPYLPKNLTWLSVTVFTASRLMSFFYFSITNIYTTELFPTYSRNSMHAMCSAIGRIGAMIAPQTPLLMVYWSDLPTLLFGLASLCAGLVTFLVPDTADDALPDTVREAECIGNKNKIVTVGIDNRGMSRDQIMDVTC